MFDGVIIGTCGDCGGPVTVPKIWSGVIPPTPQCAQCGAYAAKSYGPTIPMQDSEYRVCVFCGSEGHRSYACTWRNHGY